MEAYKILISKTDDFDRDHYFTLDLDKGTVTVAETGEVLSCEQLGEQAMLILEAGGIKPLMRARFGK